MLTHTRIRKIGLSVISVSLVSLILPLSTPAAAEGVSFAISPRAYLTWIDTSDYSEVASVVLGGLSMTVGPSGGNWDITINGLAGSGDSNWTELADTVWNPFWGPESGKFEIDRDDYEILYRYRLKDSPVYFGFGGRFIDVQEDYVHNSVGLIERDTSEITLGEIAVGFSTQVSEGSRHSVFGNLLVGIGKFDYLAVEIFEPDWVDDGTAMMLDANIGYQYVMSESVSFSTRYRVIAVQSMGFEDQQDTVHGPDLAFTFRF